MAVGSFAILWFATGRQVDLYSEYDLYKPGNPNYEDASIKIGLEREKLNQEMDRTWNGPASQFYQAASYAFTFAEPQTITRRSQFLPGLAEIAALAGILAIFVASWRRTKRRVELQAGRPARQQKADIPAEGTVPVGHEATASPVKAFSTRKAVLGACSILGLCLLGGISWYINLRSKYGPYISQVLSYRHGMTVDEISQALGPPECNTIGGEPVYYSKDSSTYLVIQPIDLRTRRLMPYDWMIFSLPRGDCEQQWAMSPVVATSDDSRTTSPDDFIGPVTFSVSSRGGFRVTEVGISCDVTRQAELACIDSAPRTK